VREQKVGIGKVLSPPLDCKERESIDSTPDSVPPLIRGPPEIWAYTDNDDEDDEEEEEGVEIK
jgi:hypothetical protein